MANITGNASPEAKEILSNVATILGASHSKLPKGFGDSILQRLKVTHASLEAKADEPLKKESRVVCELTVTEGASESHAQRKLRLNERRDMLNGGGNVHGGCSAFLVDACSTLALMVYQPGVPNVSQSLNIVYHSPATLCVPFEPARVAYIPCPSF